jgi:hypothetical protein
MNKVVAHLSKKGRGGDKTIGHLTPGEIVLPKSAQTPELLAHAKQTLGQRFGRYQVGGKDDSVNPKTGAKEFDDEDGSDNVGSDVGGDGADKYGNDSLSDGPNNDAIGQGSGPDGSWGDGGVAGSTSYPGGPEAAQAAQEAMNAANRNDIWGNISSLLGLPDIEKLKADPFGTMLNTWGQSPFSTPGMMNKGVSMLGEGMKSLMSALGIDYTPGPDGFGPTDGATGSDNIGALRDFMGGRGNTVFDPVRASKALQAALMGVDSATQTRHVQGKGYEAPAIKQVNDIFSQFNPDSNYEALLNDQVGQGLANSAFDTKQNEFRDQYTGDVNKAFPEGGGLFSPEEFNTSVDNFLNNKFNESSAEIGRFASRGNLSGAGVGIAQTNLSNQRAGARTKIDAAAHSVQDADAPKFSAIRDKALTGASNYTLGGPDFSVDPYTTERDNTAKQEQGTFSDDIGSLLGSQNLFDVHSSLNTAGAQQGQVSGAGSSNGVLDQLANRNLNKGRTRGVGTSGSGVF